ncbi:MAG: hypothetical protein J7M26_00325 [Armatimonadetes bacterium]|nr:hypothetical protein [Armatimonadota bacterium]
MADDSSKVLRIGWGHADITPSWPVMIAGQFPVRISEGVKDPITTTALALERDGEQVVFVSCDLVVISEELARAVKERLAAADDAPDPARLIMNATHTHTAPEPRHVGELAANTAKPPGIELELSPVDKYVDFAAERIAGAILEAWQSRQPGAVAYGMSYAVVGRNRRWVDVHGRSTMYGNTATPEFSHIEGYEDHSVNVLATYDSDGELTGVVVNVPSPSQAEEHLYVISADFWHETRLELKQRLGEGLFVLGQPSAAGDQSPHLLYDKAAEERMFELKGRSQRQEIAARIAAAVEDVLGCVGPTAEAEPLLRHAHETLDLPMRLLTEDDVRAAVEEAEQWRQRYEEEKARLEANPDLRKEPRWYVPVTSAYRHMHWFLGVKARYERQKENPWVPVEVHTVRIGDAAFATNPFELYLDYGIYIKALSPAVQTFLVQLCGVGGYVPSARSVSGGGYGSIPASTLIGPEGGRKLAEETVRMLAELW